MFNYIVKNNNKVELLIITPLLPNHKISKETKIGLKRNEVKFDWISYSGNNNIPTNFDLGLTEYLNSNKKPKYVMMVDNDIKPSRYMLDNMVSVLDRTDDDIAYCYVDFEFKGEVNQGFKNIQFDPIRLTKHNYISSNSMIKLDKLIEIGGVVKDSTYQRLLDWVLWLKFLSFGYHGILSLKGSFIAISNKGSISSRSDEDYKLKYNLVYNDFIKPMLTL
jgi:hypothetical protein